MARTAQPVADVAGAHPPSRRARLLWFAGLSGVALLASALAFLVLLRAAALDAWLADAYRALLDHPAAMVAAALSPVAGLLLVAWGYARRGRRRAAATRAAGARASAQPAAACAAPPP